MIILLSCFNAEGQKLAGSELRWALAHPFAAIKVKLTTNKCNRYNNRVLSQSSKIQNQADREKNLDQFSYGGKMDAYRHVFYMAAYAQKINVRKLRKLGIAHEKTNYKTFLRSGKEFKEVPDSLASVMDLYNNEIGFKLGRENKKLKLIDLEQKVLEEIGNGKALIMKRKKNGQYLDCNNKVVDLKSFAGKWSVPKCLVSSDYSYTD